MSDILIDEHKNIYDANKWVELKKDGSAHYKTGGVEPIDLYIAGDMLRDGVLKDVIKYAFRSRRELNLDKEKTIENLNKILHYTAILKQAVNEGKA